MKSPVQRGIRQPWFRARWPLFCPVLFGVVLALNAGHAFQIEHHEILQKQHKLKQIENNLKTHLAQLEQAEQKEQTLIGELEGLDFAIGLMNTEVQMLLLQQNSLHQEKAEVSQEITQRQTSVREQEVILSKRLKAIYKRGEWTALRLLFNASSISEVAYNLKIMKRIAQVDLELINQHNRFVSILSDRKNELLELEKKIENTMFTIAQNKMDLIKKRRSREVILEQVHNKREYYEKHCARIEQYRKELENWLEQNAGIPLKGSFKELKSELPWPVKGRITRYFGRQINPRFQTYTMSNGILITAEEGTPVGVVADGVIQFANWFQGYGNLVITQHKDEYFSLYGHLSEINVNVGDNVSSQHIIGRVGDTGSDSGFVLYFELRHKGVPQNPTKWLSKR